MKALILLVLLPLTAFADVGLVMRCDGATAATQAAACTGSRAWVHPQSGDYILTLPSVVADSTTVSWSNPALQFQKWIAIPGNAGVLVCAKDIPAPSAMPVGGADPCAPGMGPLKQFVAASTVVLAGTAPPSSTTDTVALTWNAPTANTDGSALADLKGFNIYQGTSATTLVKVASITLPASSYTTPNLAPGTYYFAVTAVNAAGLESAQSETVSHELTAPAPPAPKVPGAPTNVKITVTVSAGGS